MANRLPIFCSFCHKLQREVKELVQAWPENPVTICNECVGSCNELMAHANPPSGSVEKQDQAAPNAGADYTLDDVEVLGRIARCVDAWQEGAEPGDMLVGIAEALASRPDPAAHSSCSASDDDVDIQIGGPGMTPDEVWELIRTRWSRETFDKCLRMVRDGAYEKCAEWLEAITIEDECDPRGLVHTTGRRRLALGLREMLATPEVGREATRTDRSAA